MSLNSGKVSDKSRGRGFILFFLSALLLSFLFLLVVQLFLLSKLAPLLLAFGTRYPRQRMCNAPKDLILAAVAFLIC